MKNLWLKVSFFLEELCGEHGSSGGSTESIMRESCEAPFLHSFLLESSDSHTHAMSSISIESSLWSTWIICVDEELFRGRGEIHAIERILIFSNGTFEFFSIWWPFKFYKVICHMAITGSDTSTYCRNRILLSIYRFSIWSEDFERLCLSFLFFSADMRDDVIDHFWPFWECFSRSRNRLLRDDMHIFYAEFFPGFEYGYERLDWTIWLYDDASSCFLPACLRFEEGKMIGIYFGHEHRDIGSPAMSRVIWDDHKSSSSKFWFCFDDFFFASFKSGEYEANPSSSYPREIFDLPECEWLWDLMASFCCDIHIHSSCRPRACSEGFDSEIRVIREEFCKPASDHPSGSDDTDWDFFRKWLSAILTRWKIGWHSVKLKWNKSEKWWNLLKHDDPKVRPKNFSHKKSAHFWAEFFFRLMLSSRERIRQVVDNLRLLGDVSKVRLHRKKKPPRISERFGVLFFHAKGPIRVERKSSSWW